MWIYTLLKSFNMSKGMTDEQLKATFDMYDADKSGQITFDELVKLYTDCGISEEKAKKNAEVSS